jgi:hypothetical protein
LAVAARAGPLLLPLLPLLLLLLRVSAAAALLVVRLVLASRLINSKPQR